MHWASRAHNLPVLWVVFNNRAWNAVKRATHSFAKDGWAARHGIAMSDLDPAPEYAMICQASGGHADRVEDPADLPNALGRALKAVKNGQQALLDVICKKPK